MILKVPFFMSNGPPLLYNVLIGRLFFPYLEGASERSPWKMRVDPPLPLFGLKFWRGRNPKLPLPSPKSILAPLQIRGFRKGAKFGDNFALINFLVMHMI